MKKIIIMAVLVALVVLTGIVFARPTTASNSIPDCSDVKNEHYSGPCVALMIDGVITGDETAAERR